MKKKKSQDLHQSQITANGVRIIKDRLHGRLKYHQAKPENLLRVCQGSDIR